MEINKTHDTYFIDESKPVFVRPFNFNDMTYLKEVHVYPYGQNNVWYNWAK